MDNNYFTFDNIIHVLDEYCDEFKKLIRYKLAQDNRRASGKLDDSIDVKINANDDEYLVTLYSEDYMRWVEDGRKPASNFPPREAIEQWVHDKGIVPQEFNGKLPTEKQLVYLISRAIANNGTIKDKDYQGGHYIKGTVEELNDRYITKLKQQLEADWNDAQIKIFDDIQRMIKI